MCCWRPAPASSRSSIGISPGAMAPSSAGWCARTGDAGPPYIILLARDGHRLAEGLEAGADDCVHTPAGADELRARINVGLRFVALPWERAIQAASGGPQGGVVRHMHAVPELEALRSQDDDELDGDACAARFELKSVLVAG